MMSNCLAGMDGLLSVDNCNAGNICKFKKILIYKNIRITIFFKEK